ANRGDDQTPGRRSSRLRHGWPRCAHRVLRRTWPNRFRADRRRRDCPPGWAPIAFRNPKLEEMPYGSRPRIATTILRVVREVRPRAWPAITRFAENRLIVRTH